MEGECKLSSVSLPADASVKHCWSLFSCHHHPSQPVNDEPVTDNIETRQRVEQYIFTRLETYSRSTFFFRLRLTSPSRLRRRLKSDLKSFVRPKIVSEQLVQQWLDEIFDQLNDLPSLLDSSNRLEQCFVHEDLLFTVHLNTPWRQRQLRRARIVCPLEGDILAAYEGYCRETLTPKASGEKGLSSRTRVKIDLNAQYAQAESDGREYLRKLLAGYERRALPRVDLIEEMIGHGLEQMIKRPQPEEFRRLTNIASQLAFVLRTRRAYRMNLENVADDFMVSATF